MTLFGMSEKKKRGIVVPVMALAVCAVAMMGLGFALETSVTSNSNDIQQLAIDLDSEKSDLEADKSVDETSVNALFNFTVSTQKTTTEGGTKIIYKLNTGKAYFKVFGNVTEATLNISTSTPDITEMVLSIKKVSGPNDTTTDGDVAVGSPKQIYVGDVYEITIKSCKFKIGSEVIEANSDGVEKVYENSVPDLFFGS